MTAIQVTLLLKTTQNDEKQQRMSRFSEYIYCQYFVLPCRSSSGLLYDNYIQDSNMYNDLNRRGYVWLVRYADYARAQ